MAEIKVTDKSLVKYGIGKITEGKELIPEQIDLLRRTVASQANDQELQMFLYLARNYKLDPFLKEMCFIKRRVWNNFKKGYDEIPTIMTTRDGFLSIAHRSGQFDGMKTEAIIDANNKLLGAHCTVWRKDSQHPTEVKVMFNEYCVYKKQGRTGEKEPQALWGTKPVTMIKKVAESQALRKAFNVHGLYAQEEMEQEVAAGAKSDVENAAEQLKISEKLYDSPGEYAKFSEELLTEMLDTIEEYTEVEEVKNWERQNRDRIGQLNSEDQAFVNMSITSRMESALHDTTWDKPDVPKPPIKEGLPTHAEGPKDAADVKPTQKDHKELAAQQEADQKFLKEHVPAILDMKDRLKLKNWLERYRADMKPMLKEHKDTIEAYFSVQWKKATGPEGISYKW